MQQNVKFLSVNSETIYVFTVHELEILSDLVFLMRRALRELDKEEELIALNKLKYLLENESGEI